jgi:hypothetical protein
MSIEEILEAFTSCDSERGFPYAAVDEAVARREEITPGLLHVLEESIRHGNETVGNPQYTAHTFAMYLLAQFREPRAYPLLVELFSLPTALLEMTIKHIAEYGLDRLLASTCHGDLSLIKGLIYQNNIDEDVRTSGLYALVVLVVEGAVAREDVSDYYRSLFRGGLERTCSPAWNALVDCANELSLNELLEDIEAAYRDNLVNLRYSALSEAQSKLVRDPEIALQELREDPIDIILSILKKSWIIWNAPDHRSYHPVHLICRPPRCLPSNPGLSSNRRR